MANTSQGLLQRFARASSYHHDPEGRLKTIAGQVRPWDGFDRSDLQPFLDRMVVSHRPDRGTRDRDGGTTGQLHNATAYGLVKLVESGPSQVVVRKDLDKLNSSDLEPVQDSEPRKGVRDVALRAALLELWDAAGGKAAEFAQQAATEGVMLNGRSQTVRRVRVLDEQTIIPIRDRSGNAYKGYMPGGNEFADVWRMRDGSWKIVAVPTFDANQPDFDIERFRPVTSRGKHKGKADPAAKRLMRIHKNDMVALGQGQDRRLFRISQVTDGRVVLNAHNEATGNGRPIRPATLLRQGFRKVIVDEIGRVRDSDPRT